MWCYQKACFATLVIKHGKIRAVISLPEELFQPFTHAKTVAAIIEKGKSYPGEDHEIFMAIAEWCGHDSRGLQIPYDDIPQIQARYEQYKETGYLNYDHLGFIINNSEIIDDVYLPKYYNPEIQYELNLLQTSHDLLRFSDLVEQGLISFSTGHEVGKLNYGTGVVPFVRTSDISNWEIKLDPKHGLSDEVFDKYDK